MYALHNLFILFIYLLYVSLQIKLSWIIIWLIPQS